jgi:dTDP-4-dehydrorhamnose 3,5-epimerase
MKATETPIPGALIIELDCHGDARGFFLETYQRKRYQELGLDVDFVQDNRSCSTKGVLRGMHYQIKFPQGHLVYVTRGEIFDVGLDLRRNSPAFGKWFGKRLSAENHEQLFFPAGVAHGFCALSDEIEILYKCTDYYHPNDEGGVLWNDPDIGILWPVKEPIIKESDSCFSCLKDISEDKYPCITL